MAVTGFFGGLASSTAVVGTMLDHVRQRPSAADYAAAGVLLANAAMALRNLVIALAFTLSAPVGVLSGVAVPLGTLFVGAVVVVAVTADWSETVEMDIETPFSLRNALLFGALFLVVVVAGAVAEAELGRVGFYATAVATDLVSSAGATTSAVVLYRTGTLSAEAAVFAILLATAASVVVKAVLGVLGGELSFARKVVVWHALLVVVAGVVSVPIVL